MAAIAALVTRVIRASPLEAVTVGAGYAVGGLVFDALLYVPILIALRRKYPSKYFIMASLVSGTSAIVPYLLLNLSVLGSSAFLSLVPLYVYSTVKGTILSLLGTVLGLAVSPRLRKFGQQVRLDDSTRRKGMTILTRFILKYSTDPLARKGAIQ